MTTLTIVGRDGSTKQIEAKDGVSVMQNLRDAGNYELTALCGGACSCATCHCFFEDETIVKIGEAEGDESDLLSGSSHTNSNSRLSCQVIVSDVLANARITIAPED